MTNNNNILTNIFTKNGLSEYIKYANTFEHLYTALTETNKLYNLTAVTEPEKVYALHFADSLLALKYIEKDTKILDIGCGAGFPSLPIAIARPDVNVLALDSTAKKIDFALSFAKSPEINLKNFSAISGRAEELSKSQMRESFDLVTARAVARLNVLCELALPFVKVGGRFLAMKGSAGKEELSEAKKAIAVLGGKLISFEETELVCTVADTCPDNVQKRTMILIEKVSPTPESYPRQYAKITKKPL